MKEAQVCLIGGLVGGIGAGCGMTGGGVLCRGGGGVKERDRLWHDREYDVGNHGFSVH